MSGWCHYYEAVLAAQSSDFSSFNKSISSLFASRRVSDDEDAKLIYHAFMLLSDVYSKAHGDANLCEVPPAVFKVRQSQVSIPVPGQQPHSDRLWNVIKSGEKMNAFHMSDNARKIRSVYMPPEQGVHSLVEMNAAILNELGLGFVSEVVNKSHTVPHSVEDYLNRRANTFPTENVGIVNAEIERIINDVDAYLNCNPLPLSGVLSELARGFAISIPLGLRISTARLVVRLARTNLMTKRVGESLLHLDDVQATILSNCSYYDMGLFHYVRAEALIALLAELPDSCEDYGGILCDALKCMQHSIAALDRADSKDLLLEAVGIAAALCHKLDIGGMKNFYAVKYIQISASDMCECFFPAEDGQALGQPKIPSEITHSPKPKKKEESPMSPVGSGRGLQTLIRWSHSN